MVSPHIPAKPYTKSREPSEPNQYYHVSCMEQIFPELGALVDRGTLQMEGWVSQLEHITRYRFEKEPYVGPYVQWKWCNISFSM